MLTQSNASPLLLLKSGTGSKVTFIVPGHGDSAAELSLLCSKIRTGHRIYGLQPRGIDGIGEPFDRIEDIARHFVSAIVDVQPHGPYHLIGFSLGGIVAFEAAHQLRRRHESIAFLGLLDTYPHPRFWPLRCWLSVLKGRARHHLSQFAALPSHNVLPYLSKISAS